MSETESRRAVDRLARLRARMRTLQDEEAALVEVLRRSNHDTIAGRRFVATISRSHREVLDPGRVRELLADRTPTKTVSTVSIRTTPRTRPAPAGPAASRAAAP